MSLEKKRIYFSTNDDLYLLTEVVGQNPFEHPNRWNIIQMNILQISGKNINTRTLKDRVKHLVNKYLSKEKVLQFKSGIEEEVNEFDDLLRIISEIMNEFKNVKSKNKCTKLFKESLYQKGFEAREAATLQIDHSSSTSMACQEDFVNEVVVLANTSDTKGNEECAAEPGAEQLMEPEVQTFPDTPSSKRKILVSQKTVLTPARKRSATGIKQASLNFLDKKNNRWFEIRSRELALQERNQSLQERKMEFDILERKKKMELEERKVEMDEMKLKIELDIFKNQQRLLEIAFQGCSYCKK